jgi:hypothetical protein
MMTVKEVAEILLSRQNSSYSFILDGATRTKLTFEGFEYARSRGWIELDEATSCMRVSMRAVKLDEIKSAAAAENSAPIQQDAASVKSSGHEVALDHVCENARRNNPDGAVVESQPPAPVIKSEDSWRNFMLFENQSCHGREALDEYNPAPTAQPPHPGGPEQAYEVGDPVLTVEDGRTFQATVQAMQPDGSMVLSFGTEKPSKIKPSYKKDEVTKAVGQKQQQQSVQPSKPTPSQPAEPQTAMPTSGPAGPGIGHQ